MSIGKSINRVDAYDKVTGKAKFTDDLVPKDALIAKILHSTIANGKVKKIDTSKAYIPGVIEIFTCFQVPQIKFPTAGHPWSTDKSHQDVSNRLLLDSRVRFYGDDIAVVVAEDEVTALKALNLIKVEYEEYDPILSIEDALKSDILIHEEAKNNILASANYKLGDKSFDEIAKNKDLKVFKDTFKLPTVQHCFMENANSFAYEEGGKIVVVSSTQIPHIARRVIGQALGLPWGQVRVIKPYIGGGFGGKQDVLYEPLNAWLCKQLGGKCVKLELTREESFINTRVRHAMNIEIQSAVNSDGELIARKAKVVSSKGAYASHSFSVTANAASVVRQLYQDKVATEVEFATVYTNLPVSGAMRGYGIPQICFALESHMENIANAMNFDNIEFRKKNMIKEGFVDPLNGIPSITNELDSCIDTGSKYINFKEKYLNYQKQKGDKRKGVGFAIFSYKTGVYPIALETSSCRMVLNQDGSIQVQVGATEIGQGADTVFMQMTSEVTGISPENIFIMSTQDTDITPYDSGAYASRQSYVTGQAIKKCGLELKQKIIDYYKYLHNIDAADIIENYLVDENNNKLSSVSEVSIEAFYHTKNSKHITAEVTHHCDTNTISHGCTFVEIEVDMKLGLIKVLDIINVHDSGTIINPKTARGQVHGGVSMGLGYALSEELLFNPKTGKPYNGDFLGYKIQTSLDTPNISCEFIEKYDPTGPFGNKSLGEPPTLSIAPAIRNAVLNATGIKFNEIPLTPERVFNKIKSNEVNRRAYV